jgi:hypothetical protein
MTRAVLPMDAVPRILPALRGARCRARGAIAFMLGRNGISIASESAGAAEGTVPVIVRTHEAHDATSSARWRSSAPRGERHARLYRIEERPWRDGAWKQTVRHDGGTLTHGPGY